MEEKTEYPGGLVIRRAAAGDAALVLSFIEGLAEYEKMSDQVVADAGLLHKWLFEEKKAEVIIAEADGAAVGFALFFTSFSTFLGRPGIYLEDLFVKPEMRGRGYGKMLLAYLARLVRERGYGRLEWACLDWNEPSIQFYLSLGAKPQDEWTTYRMTGDQLSDLAKLAEIR